MSIEVSSFHYYENDLLYKKVIESCENGEFKETITLISNIPPSLNTENLYIKKINSNKNIMINSENIYHEYNYTLYYNNTFKQKIIEEYYDKIITQVIKRNGFKEIITTNKNYDFISSVLIE